MKSIVRLIMLLLLVGGWGLAALSLHVVRTSEDIPITLVPKDRFGLTDTYVDVRGWTLDTVAQHPEVVERLIHCGHADTLKHVVDAKDGDVAAQLIDAMQHADKPEKKESRRRAPATSQIAKSFLGF